MKKIVVIIFTAVLGTSFSQTPVSGTVTDADGQPIPGANVYLADTYDGATTDSLGRFKFISDETGDKNLVVKFIGYRPFEKQVILSGAPVVMKVILAEEISELNAVIITAGSFTASDEGRRTTFRAMDIATTAGATADIAGALNMLPGTQKVGESGRLFVRGGDGHEARTFIDGMLVANPYNASAPNTPSRGRFLPFMFKGTSFSTGGYSAEYGQALSSALTLDSRDQSEITRTDIGILSVGGDLTHTQVWERASWAGKIGYTNIGPYNKFIDQEVDWRSPFKSVEGNTVFRQQTGKHGLLKVYGNFNDTRFSVLNHDIDDPSQTELFALKNNYRYINTTYRDVLNENWIIRGGFSHTFSGNDIASGGADITDTEKIWHAKTVFEGNISQQAELTAGAEVIDRHHALRTAGLSELGFREQIMAVFTEAQIYVSNEFVTRAGVRTEYNSLREKVYLDPRLSLAYKAGSHGSVSLAYGKFRQSATNELLRMNPSLEQERADHYIASYQILNNDRTFRLEAYHKQYANLVKYGMNGGMELKNSGKGYARGAEVFWRDNRTFRRTDYWIAYSFLDTKRNYLNFPYEATPAFASAHNLSIVYKYFFTRLKTQFGASYAFASGRPYHDPNKEKFNDGKTPDYHDLSINVAWLPKPNVIVYGSVTNITGRDNIFGYEFSSSLNDQGFYNSRPIRQPAPRFLFVGIFITFSKEKSVNQLPSL